MEQIVGPGKFVEYSYKVYDEATGEVLFETPRNEPDNMVFGVSVQVVPALMQSMDGLKAGDKFGITLPPELAFGLRDDENVVMLEKEIFMRDGELASEVAVGAVLPMVTGEGYRVVGTVQEIGDEEVKMDFNHPFAGKTIRYDGVVERVREATEEEKNPKRGCGGCGGGCQGGCGSDCSEGHCNCQGC